MGVTKHPQPLFVRLTSEGSIFRLNCMTVARSNAHGEMPRLHRAVIMKAARELRSAAANAALLQLRDMRPVSEARFLFLTSRSKALIFGWRRI